MSDAVWLLEHVADTGGAEYMKVASRKLNWAQFFCLDVAAFYVIASATALWVWRWKSRRRAKMKQA